MLNVWFDGSKQIGIDYLKILINNILILSCFILNYKLALLPANNTRTLKSIGAKYGYRLVHRYNHQLDCGVLFCLREAMTRTAPTGAQNRLPYCTDIVNHNL